MVALCCISLLNFFSVFGTDTSAVLFVAGAQKHTDSFPNAHPTNFSVDGPFDTVYIKTQRIDFATLGRVVLHLQSNETEKSLTDLMDDAGVFFKQYGVAGSSTISRRGADANQTQINWNGLPVNNPMLGMSDFNTFLGWGTADIFLVEGGNSALVGSGSMGGTLVMRNPVNFKTKELGVGRWQYKSKGLMSLGSFGERNLAFEVSGRSEIRFFSMALGDFYHKNAFFFNDLGLELVNRKMERALRKQQMLRSVLGVKWGQHQLKGIFEVMGMSRELGLALGSVLPLGKQRDKNLRSVLEHQWSMSKGWSMTQRLGGVVDEIVYFSASNSVVGPDGFTDKGSLSRGQTLHYQNEIYYHRGAWKMLWGTDFQWQHAQTEFYLGWAKRALPASLFGVNWAHKKWSAVGNARYEWLENVPTAGLSLQHQANHKLTYKANVHNSFRRPTLNDLFWVSGAALQPLKPEKGWGAEMGVSAQQLQPFGKCSLFKITTEVTAYYRELDFPILWVPAGAVWRAMNLTGGGRYAGIQASMNAKYTNKASVFALNINLDRVQSRVKQTTTSAEYQQIFIPDLNGNLSLSLQRPKFHCTLNVNHVGNRFVQTDNQALLPAYNLLQARVNLPKVFVLSEFICDLSVDIQNAAQVQYVSMPGRPMPGRSVKISILIHH